MSLVEFNKVNYSIGEKMILKDVSFSIAEKDFCVLIGHNGSGKSTILKMLLGCIRPSSGNVLNPKRVCIVHQNISENLFADLTVLENFKLFGFSDADAIASYLKDFNANIALDQVVNNLSGGEKQALALALRLYQKPDLLLLDEHTSALDPKTAKKIMDLTYAKTKDIACIMVTHNMDYIKANKLFEMEKGCIKLINS